jgi:hypothetical protein
MEPACILNATAGGWSTQPTRLEPAEQAPVTFPEPNHLDAESQGRVGLRQVGGLCHGPGE